MFFLLSKTLDLAFEPIAWVIGLVAVAAVLVLRRNERRRLALALLVGATCVLIVSANPMVANRVWWWLESDAPSSHRPEVEYDVVVLLGGIVPNGLGASSAPYRYGDGVERLLATYDLLRTGGARRAIISGGAPQPMPGMDVEATLLAAQLETWGVARDRLEVEAKSLNTRQNALEVARILHEDDVGRVLLVTSAFHMKRAAGCFRAAGVDADTLPVDRRAVEPRLQPWEFLPRSGALERTSDALRELSGRFIYTTLGYAR